MSQQTSNLEQTVRGMQIITAALVLGVVVFAAIAVFVVGAMNEESSGVIVSAVGLVWSALAFVMHLVVPAIMTRQLSRGGNREQLYGAYRAKTIVGLALLEGAAFFNIVALIIEHNWWSLAIAGGLVFWMLSAFPSTTKVEHWVETQLMQSGAE